MNCPKCGHPAPGTAKVCVKCGSSLKNASKMSRSGPAPCAGAPASLRPGQGGNSVADKLFNPKNPAAAAARQQLPLAKQTKSFYLIIWAVMFAALPIYCVVWRLVSQDIHGISFGASPLRSFGIVMIAIAVLTWSAGIVVASQALSPKRLVFSVSKSNLAQNIFSFGIISLALIEAVAIYGMQLVFMGFFGHILFPFVAASALGLLIHLKFALAAWRFHASIPDDPPVN